MNKGLCKFLTVLLIAVGCSPKTEIDNSIGIDTDQTPGNEKVIRISTPTDIRGFSHMKTLLEKAYKKIGYDAVFINMPAVRSMHDANEGIHADAEMIRTNYVIGKMNNSIKIPVPMGEIKFCAVVKETDIKIEKWEDFNNYPVAVIKGYVITENNISGPNVLKVENTEQALAMLQNGRVKAAALIESEATFLIQLLGYDNLKVLEPAVEKIKVYHFINKKFQNIVPQLTEAFRELTGNEE